MDDVPEDEPEPGKAGEESAEEEVADPPSELTPEEQMAQFEDALKEEDWGHQPC